MRKLICTLALAGAAGTVFGDVNVNTLLGESAMWLDAASPANYEMDQQGRRAFDIRRCRRVQDSYPDKR